MANQGYKVKLETLKNGKEVFRVRYYNEPFSYNDIGEKNVFWKGTNKNEAYEQRKYFEKNYGML